MFKPDEYAVDDINIYMIYLKMCDSAYILYNTPIIIWWRQTAQATGTVCPADNPITFFEHTQW